MFGSCSEGLTANCVAVWGRIFRTVVRLPLNMPAKPPSLHIFAAVLWNDLLRLSAIIMILSLQHYVAFRSPPSSMDYSLAYLTENLPDCPAVF